MLKINETFLSIDGEVNNQHQGKLSFFIRLAGCNLRCSYCDTSYSWTTKDSKNYSADQLFGMVVNSGVSKVTITGGEPLLQNKELLPLLELLAKNKIYTSIETNGSIYSDDLYRSEHIYYIWDYKLPSSGHTADMDSKVLCKNILYEDDWIKFVIQNHNDFLSALSVIREYFFKHKNIAFSPVINKFPCKTLIATMIEYNILYPVVSVQLHKLVDMK